MERHYSQEWLYKRQTLSIWGSPRCQNEDLYVTMLAHITFSQFTQHDKLHIFKWGSWLVCVTIGNGSLLSPRSKEKGTHPPPEPFLKSLIPSLKLKTVFQTDKPKGSRSTRGVDYVISSAALWWLILKVGDEWGGGGAEGWQRTGASNFVTLL